MKKHILWHVLLALLVISVFSVTVMLLWNWLMPSIFNMKSLNFWQALGLLTLFRILFGGMSGKYWEKRSHRHHCHSFCDKFRRMSDEDRKDFIKRKFLKHGFDHDFFQQNESEKYD
ncbi:MAG: hypothetical protein LBP63_10595 [Prevotellaceae bacterium]|jgi:membrane protein required for beta-lactamase induction|nr:hypothetical protein [Prevotellaceae bacterium]